MNHNRPSPKVYDVCTAVEELHCLNAKELNKLMRESYSYLTLRLKTGKGSFVRVDMERLVLGLPLHLLAYLASRGAELPLRYLLRGVRLLHSLSDLAVRHPKLEQLMLHEVKVREQVLDLIIYTLITLANTEQEARVVSSFTLLHTALVACSLHLLPAFVATEWHDVVPVLLTHPQVDIFMDAAFDAVTRGIGLLQTKLKVLSSKLISEKIAPLAAESIAQVIGQHCEASLQVLQSLCQPIAFRDHILQHQELCKHGGILCLARVVMKLHIPLSLMEFINLRSLVSRIKSKALSILVKFCETESVSFLDEVADDRSSLRLAQIVAEEVLDLVKSAMHEDLPKIQSSSEEGTPLGPLYIHALRLADILSDDSNFRILVMDNITPDFARVLAQAPTIFSSEWCGNLDIVDEIKTGLDAVLIYDPFRASGAAMQSFKGSAGPSAKPCGSYSQIPDESLGCSSSVEKNQPASFAQERSALFVKIIANLHCFNPEICPVEEKERFLDMFVKSLTTGPFNPSNSSFFLSAVQTAVRVCENLFLLLNYVSSLPSEVVSDEDLQLASSFYDALHDIICPSGVSKAFVQEDPVVAYVKDAHERKRKMMFSNQQTERWRRILQISSTSDREQSNSVNKIIANPPASKQPVLEDTYQEAESTGIGHTGQADVVMEYPREEEVDEAPSQTELDLLNTAREEPKCFGNETENLKTLVVDPQPSQTETVFPEDSGAESGNGLEKIGNKDEEEEEKSRGEIAPEVRECMNDDNRIDQSIGDNVAEIEQVCSDKSCCDDKEDSKKIENNEEQLDLSRDEDDLPLSVDQTESMKPQNDETSLDQSKPELTSQTNDYNEPSLNEKEMELIKDENALDSQIGNDYCTPSSTNVAMKQLEDVKSESPLHINMPDEILIKEEVDMGQDNSLQTSAMQALVGGSDSNNNNNHMGEDHVIQVDKISGVADDSQPKKRKRNLMNEKQIIVIENALKTDPDMQRYPKLIEQWSAQLSRIGPEISFQQLKNWLNNRRARLARQARETQPLDGETLSPLDSCQAKLAPASYSGISTNDQLALLSDDSSAHDSTGAKRAKIVTGKSPIAANFKLPEDMGIGIGIGLGIGVGVGVGMGIAMPPPMEADSFYCHGRDFPDAPIAPGSRKPTSVKFVKCEAGQYVSLLDKDGKEMALGVVNQVEGKWQGIKLEELGLCLVKISDLKVEKSTRLPHPSSQGGNTFEDAEKSYGCMIVAWDTNRIFLIS